MQHYLTKWEFYILFVQLRRFQNISVSMDIFKLHLYKQLGILRKQAFFHLCPQVTIEEIRQNFLAKTVKNIRPVESKVMNIYFQDRKGLNVWLKEYLTDYKEDRLHSRRELFCCYEQSMQRTLALLKTYSNINSKKVLLKPEIDDGSGCAIRANTRTRLYEDILILMQGGYISVDDIFLDNSKVLTSLQNYSDSPSFSLRLSFLMPIEKIEQALLQQPAYLGIRITEHNEVFFRDQKLEIASSAHLQITLLKFLCDNHGHSVTREAVYEALHFTSKSKKAPKHHNLYEDDFDERTGTRKKGPKSGIKKRYQDRLKNLIRQVLSKFPPKSIEIINTANEGVFLKLGKTEVSQ